MTSNRWWTTGKDWIDLLYWPYTLMFISFGIIGFMLAPTQNWFILVLGIFVLFLAVGVLAHTLDEIKGRPLNTSISDDNLWIVSFISFFLITLVMFYLTLFYSIWTLPLFLFSAFIVFSYNLELFNGKLHNDYVFMFGFGAVPQFLGYYMSGLEIPTISMIIIFAGFSSICGVETTVNHFVKFASEDYKKAYDKTFSYLQRSVWAAVFLPSVVALGFTLWRLGL